MEQTNSVSGSLLSRLGRRAAEWWLAGTKSAEKSFTALGFFGDRDNAVKRRHCGALANAGGELFCLRQLQRVRRDLLEQTKLTEARLAQQGASGNAEFTKGP